MCEIERHNAVVNKTLFQKSRQSFRCFLTNLARVKFVMNPIYSHYLTDGGNMITAKTAHICNGWKWSSLNPSSPTHSNFGIGEAVFDCNFAKPSIKPICPLHVVFVHSLHNHFCYFPSVQTSTTLWIPSGGDLRESERVCTADGWLFVGCSEIVLLE